jgi:energy-coupling factor transport system ATP-binding protein
MDGPLIAVKNVNYKYKEGPLVLQDISISIKKGEFIAFVGQNGAGKTTCAKLLNGILHPTSGEVIVNGQNTSEVPASEVARTVGYSYQNPDHQIWALHVEDEIAFGPRNLGLSADEVSQRVEDALALSDLAEERESYTFSLGWGERQKLAVASVMAMRPQVIIVDEPTTGLDWNGSVRIMNLINELNKSGMTVIIITHDMEIVTAYAHRVIVFTDGKIVTDGPIDQVMYDVSSLAKADLRPPQFIRVALALEICGISLSTSPDILKEEIISTIEMRSKRVNS